VPIDNFKFLHLSLYPFQVSFFKRNKIGIWFHYYYFLPLDAQFSVTFIEATPLHVLYSSFFSQRLVDCVLVDRGLIFGLYSVPLAPVSVFMLCYTVVITGAL
jgi:hypothetical protein